MLEASALLIRSILIFKTLILQPIKHIIMLSFEYATEYEYAMTEYAMRNI